MMSSDEVNPYLLLLAEEQVQFLWISKGNWFKWPLGRVLTRVAIYLDYMVIKVIISYPFAPELQKTDLHGHLLIDSINLQRDIFSYSVSNKIFFIFCSFKIEFDVHWFHILKHSENFLPCLKSWQFLILIVFNASKMIKMVFILRYSKHLYTATKVLK